ncbi:MAG: 30S ribosomal protein S16 [Patescibacteria group bacterium]
MVKIRLIRIGKKNDPHFRLVVQDSRKAPKGDCIEFLGNLAPILHRVQINKERIKYWLDKGAQPTDSVYNLLVKKGIIIGKKRTKHSKSKNKEQAGNNKIEKEIDNKKIGEPMKDD